MPGQCNDAHGSFRVTIDGFLHLRKKGISLNILQKKRRIAVLPLSPFTHSRSRSHHLQSPRMPLSVARQILLSQTCAEGQRERDHFLDGTAFTHAIALLQCRVYSRQTARVRQSVLSGVQRGVLLAYVSEEENLLSFREIWTKLSLHSPHPFPCMSNFPTEKTIF